MCLIIKKDDKFIKAVEDLIVYKIAVVGKSIQGIHSSYQKMYVGYINDLPIHLKLNIRHVIRQKRGCGPDDKFTIEKGFHSFLRLADAKERAENYAECVFECVIPKGSWYIAGKFDTPDKQQSIVSTQIIYKNWIRDYR